MKLFKVIGKEGRAMVVERMKELKAFEDSVKAQVLGVYRRRMETETPAMVTAKRAAVDECFNLIRRHKPGEALVRIDRYLDEEKLYVAMLQAHEIAARARAMRNLAGPSGRKGFGDIEAMFLAAEVK